MYAAGNMPDHVTRYNHKDPNRWMVPTARREIDWATIGYSVLCALCTAGIILSAIIILQGV